MAGEGVGIRTRSLTRRPVEISTGAPLMPVPPKSMPRTTVPSGTESLDVVGAVPAAEEAEGPHRGTYGQEDDSLDECVPFLEAVQILDLDKNSLEKSSGALICWCTDLCSEEYDATVRKPLAEAGNASAMILFSDCAAAT